MFIQWSPMGFPRFLSLYNIRTALLIFVLVPFLLRSVVMRGLQLLRLEMAAAPRIQDYIELIARSIHRPLSHALEHDLQLTLRRTVSSAGEIGRVYGVYVYDRDGKRITAEGPRKIQVQDIEAATLVTEGSERAAFEEVAGEQVFSYFMPLTDSGGRIKIGRAHV